MVSELNSCSGIIVNIQPTQAVCSGTAHGWCMAKKSRSPGALYFKVVVENDKRDSCPWGDPFTANIAENLGTENQLADQFQKYFFWF
ncbi:unnamed protein product [Clavelina lepadiformis]|uniref:Uncharacterized protein n=1 Tax=Clavelina lepadiformis TaxID=159417 RepID=A0ABP0FI36_CLALP